MVNPISWDSICAKFAADAPFAKQRAQTSSAQTRLGYLISLNLRMASEDKCPMTDPSPLSASMTQGFGRTFSQMMPKHAEKIPVCGHFVPWKGDHGVVQPSGLTVAVSQCTLYQGLTLYQYEQKSLKFLKQATVLHEVLHI